VKWLLVLALAACGGKTAAPPPPTTTPPPAESKPVEPAKPCTTISCALPVIEKYATEMCACADKTCAEAVNNRFTQWGAEMAKHSKGTDVQPTPEEVQTLTTHVTRYSECYANLSLEGTGSASP
jgi:hypothetical protein